MKLLIILTALLVALITAAPVEKVEIKEIKEGKAKLEESKVQDIKTDNQEIVKVYALIADFEEEEEEKMKFSGVDWKSGGNVMKSVGM